MVERNLCKSFLKVLSIKLFTIRIFPTTFAMAPGKLQEIFKSIRVWVSKSVNLTSPQLLNPDVDSHEMWFGGSSILLTACQLIVMPLARNVHSDLLFTLSTIFTSFSHGDFNSIESTHIHLHIYIYVCVEREKERDRIRYQKRIIVMWL